MKHDIDYKSTICIYNETESTTKVPYVYIMKYDIDYKSTICI